MKTCSRCKREKSYNDFNKATKNKDGYDFWCRQCKKEYYNKPENKKRKADKDKEYYLKNKEKITEYKKEWSEKNKEKIKTRYKKWYDNNREIIYKKQITKRKENIQSRLSHVLRTRLNKAIKLNLKYTSTIELLGCSVQELKDYLESKFDEKMTWDNYGKKGWHIDHIKPCIKFDLSKIEEQKKCFHYTNLQPLWAKDNYSKGGK